MSHQQETRINYKTIEQQRPAETGHRKIVAGPKRSNTQEAELQSKDGARGERARG
jgi:hypothetical protein